MLGAWRPAETKEILLGRSLFQEDANIITMIVSMAQECRSGLKAFEDDCAEALIPFNNWQPCFGSKPLAKRLMVKLLIPKASGLYKKLETVHLQEKKDAVECYALATKLDTMFDSFSEIDDWYSRLNGRKTKKLKLS